MDFDTRVGAYGVAVEDDQVLLSLWSEPRCPRWTLPGGGLELGETPEEACVREIEEETGLRAEPVELLGVTTGMIPTERRLRGEGRPLLTVQVLYRVRVLGGTLRAEVGGSSSDARWIELRELSRWQTEDTGDAVPHVYASLERAGVVLPTWTGTAPGAS